MQIELAHHGGKDNGRLPVTYNDFVAYGVDRHAVAPALRELVALGFIQITVQGRAGNAEWRTPSLYRLTFRDASGGYNGSDEWRAINEDEAKAIAKAARRAKTKSQCGDSPTFGEQNPHRKRFVLGAESTTTGQGGESHTTLDIPGRARFRRAASNAE